MPKSLALQLGLQWLCFTSVVLCVMATVGHAGTVKFFNSLLHGVDVSTIVRMDVPLWEAGVGIVETFVLGWLIGACIAGFYNAVLKNK